VVDVAGQLKDRTQVEGGVGYSYRYSFSDSCLEKRIRLRYYEQPDSIQIIEPVIIYPGTVVEQTGPRCVLIHGEKLQIEFLLTGTKGSLSWGKEAEKYKACYPALKGWPIQITLVPEKESIGDEICFEFRVKENKKDKEE
jgi:hypothetical protein